ncbi:P-loop containing nucleoside triphosphate hydrolase protein [Suillus lakei]|nr:P-loop containing nucleoside triphosphate hydrolase protein [Suillus lakei]
MGDAIFLVVMGVSGTGKSTLGAALSKAFRLPFIDGDDLHPPIQYGCQQAFLSQLGIDHRLHAEPNTMPETEKTLADYERSMIGRSGQPSPGEMKFRSRGSLIACSALKGSYSLSEAGAPEHSGKLPTWFVYMKGSREVLTDRMMKRQGHFMKAAMLDSQLKTLESPENEEGVVTVSIEWSTEDQVREVVRALEDRGEGQQHVPRVEALFT